MKKNILFALLATSLFMTVGCEDNKEQFLDEYDTILYFRNSGELPITVFSTGDNATYDLIVNKAGSNYSSIASVEVGSMDAASLEAYNTTYRSNYKALPDDCYSFDIAQVNFASSETYKTVTVSFDTERIKAVLNENNSNYVIPMYLYNGSDSINADKQYAFIIPTVETPTIGFEESGYVNKPLPDDGATDDTVSVNLVIPVEDAWNLQCDLNLDIAALDNYNQTNGTNYKVLPEEFYEMSNEVIFENGQVLAPVKVVVHKSKMDYGSFILPLSIDNVSKDEFVIDENNRTVLMGISFTLPEIPLTADMLSTNALEPTEGSLANLLDGDISTYFHSSWSVTVEEEHYVQVALKESIQEFIFNYTTRESNGNAAPAEFYVSVSSDGENFTELRRFTTAEDNLPISGATSWISPTIQSDTEIKYIRFVNVVNTAGYDNFVWSEFSLSGK